MCSRVANRNAVMYVVISMIYLLRLLVLKFIHFLLYWFLKPEAAVKQISSWVRVHEIYSYLLSTWCVIWREYRTCSWQRTVFLGKMASSGRYKEHCRAKVLLPGWNLCWCLFWGIRQSSTFFCAAHEGFKVIKLPYQQTEVPYRADCSLSNKFVAPPR